MDSRESRRSAVYERRTERLMADLDRRHLQRAFRLFNKTLFDGELPRYRVVVEQPHNVLENRCIPSGCVGGLCDRTARTIFSLSCHTTAKVSSLATLATRGLRLLNAGFWRMPIRPPLKVPSGLTR